MIKNYMAADGFSYFVYDLDTSESYRYSQEHLLANNYGLRDIILEDGQVVFDIGANIGYVSFFLAKRFPKARIFAIEGLKENAEMIKKAAEEQGFANVTTIQTAVTAVSRPCRISCEYGMSGAAKERHNESSAIYITAYEQTKTIPQIMEEFGITFVDLLKINIEGAEYEVLGSLSDEWLKEHVGNIIGEFHYSGSKVLEERMKKIFPNINIIHA